jgi:hypothetical protein
MDEREVCGFDATLSNPAALAFLADSDATILPLLRSSRANVGGATC